MVNLAHTLRCKVHRLCLAPQAILPAYFVLKSTQTAVYTEGDTMKLIGNITLSSGPDSDKPDRCFIHQTLEIRGETRTSRLELDGKLSIARCPKNVIWHGGSLDFLAGARHIKIVSHGLILIDEVLDNDSQPWSVPDGVRFDVTEC
jgi:hypothetical protein